MGWCTTSDLDQFAAAAEGYLRSRAAENTMLLSAALAVRTGLRSSAAGRRPGSIGPSPAGGGAMLYGWWEPPDGGGARGAFIDDPSAPLLIAGRAPEMAAALAVTLSKLGRPISGVDAPVEAADAFAATWSRREGSSIRVHRLCRVYRLTKSGAGLGQPDALPGPGGTGAPGGNGGLSGHRPFGSWPPAPGPAGRLRVLTPADRGLLIDWLTAFGVEAGERIGAADAADDLLSYGGAVVWEAPQRVSRIREDAHYLVSPHLVGPQHRDAVQPAEPSYLPVALAAVARPVAGTVRINLVYTPPERRRNGHAAAVTLMASRAAFAGSVPGAGPGAEPSSEVVLIADGNRPDRQITRLGYQLVGERTVLRFGPGTGPQPTQRANTRPMPRLPTGPLPRLRR